jgi:hypothetical protein
MAETLWDQLWVISLMRFDWQDVCWRLGGMSHPQKRYWIPALIISCILSATVFADGPKLRCPGCMYEKDGVCVDPPACASCGHRGGPSCSCAPPPSCPGGQHHNATCECVDRCDGYMRNCSEFQGCMNATSGNGSSCNGRKNQSQLDGCWQDKQGC